MVLGFPLLFGRQHGLRGLRSGAGRVPRPSKPDVPRSCGVGRGRSHRRSLPGHSSLVLGELPPSVCPVCRSTGRRETLPRYNECDLRHPHSAPCSSAPNLLRTNWLENCLCFGKAGWGGNRVFVTVMVDSPRPWPRRERMGGAMPAIRRGRATSLLRSRRPVVCRRPHPFPCRCIAVLASECMAGLRCR